MQILFKKQTYTLPTRPTSFHLFLRQIVNDIPHSFDNLQIYYQTRDNTVIQIICESSYQTFLKNMKYTGNAIAYLGMKQLQEENISRENDHSNEVIKDIDMNLRNSTLQNTNFLRGIMRTVFTISLLNSNNGDSKEHANEEKKRKDIKSKRNRLQKKNYDQDKMVKKHLSVKKEKPKIYFQPK